MDTRIFKTCAGAMAFLVGGESAATASLVIKENYPNQAVMPDSPYTTSPEHDHREPFKTSSSRMPNTMSSATSGNTIGNTIYSVQANYIIDMDLDNNFLFYRPIELPPVIEKDSQAKTISLAVKTFPSPKKFRDKYSVNTGGKFVSFNQTLFHRRH